MKRLNAVKMEQAVPDNLKRFFAAKDKQK